CSSTDDLEQINDDDMEEMDLKWQVALISIRIKKFHKRTGRKLQFDTKDPVGFDKTKVECFNCHKIWHFARDYRAKGNQDSRRRDDGYDGNKTRDHGRRPAYQDDSKANSGSDNEASDLEDTFVNDRYADGMHAIPPHVTGIYMPSRPDIDIDYSKFTYGPKQTSTDETDYKPSEYASCESDSSVETSTSMPEPVENASKVVREPKVWTDTAIIEEYESDSDNALMSNVQEDKEKHSFAFTDSVKHVKTSKENIKETSTTDDPHRALKDKGIVDSGCSRHMTGNKAYLADYQEFKGGSVAFGGSNGWITGKGKIKAVLLKIPRQHNMYSFNLKNIDPSRDLACWFAKASIDESNKWYRRLGHVNFKNLNKLVKGNLVRCLPSKIFENDHTCVACRKGKQHKASCKAKTVSSVNKPLQILHMDLFGPTSVRSINHKTYCLVITDGFNRFSWVYILKSKDEITPILKDFIRQAKNQFYHKVKTIRSDNRTEFKKKDLIELCGLKGITREYSNARTPQQIGIAERKNKTLIKAVDSFLPTTFGVEAVNTACYFLNRVLVTKPQNKTPYELLT
nr:putative ribonuclease H-like domain-containing protein [Tanacetum cinerariifolium]